MDTLPVLIMELLERDPSILADDRIFSGTESHPRETGVRLHPPDYIELGETAHIMPEICCILDGEQGMMWNGRYFRFTAGDIVIIPRMTSHFEKYTDRAAMYRNLWIGFPSMTRIILALGRYRAGTYAIEDSLHLSAPAKWAEKFIAYGPDESGGKIRKDLRDFWRFLRGRIRAEDFFWNRRDRETDWRRRSLDRARRYIDENVTRKLTLKEVAGQIKISPAYFSSLFKKEYGETVFDHIIWERLRHARRLLEETDLTITEIAHRLHYTDIYYFSRIFKRNFGITPTRFRDRYL